MSEAVPSFMAERQPVEKFMSLFTGKTDSMLVEAKHTWGGNVQHEKHFSAYAERLFQLDKALQAQLNLALTVDGLNVPIGLISKVNPKEAFVVEAILRSLQRDLLHHHAPKQALPHTNVYSSLFDGVYILENRRRVMGASITDARTDAQFSLVGKSHLPQQVMDTVLMKK